jgi:hypothetical protein
VAAEGRPAHDEGEDDDDSDNAGSGEAPLTSEMKKKFIRRAKGLVDEYLQYEVIDDVCDGLAELIQEDTDSCVDMVDIVKNLLNL